MEFDYPEHGVGRPRATLIQSPQDVTRVRPLDIEHADRPGQRIESVRKMAQAIGRTHSVLGWVEGPIALYADLRGVESMFLDLIDNPQMYLATAEILIENQIRFARAQVAAGADMIGVGDAVASQISPSMYRQFVLPFEKKLFEAIHAGRGRRQAPHLRRRPQQRPLHGPDGLRHPRRRLDGPAG